ncbi:zinc-binding dehydrogenase [Oenococcus sicerae]|uniref:Quinone oxidoreductase n=1 Tax=Oenococcus sicerae TaxID=2203724 RepID=A0AAJ1VMC9_9LACO|nr:zinc-binding dehydrogenase [Oenococcus sicerae]MDN6900428.1 quinone oxidoreductase [Oenococcus sicerae]QAS69552.1 zinc-binding dehydrogenase [Oenococcus sicerae]
MRALSVVSQRAKIIEVADAKISRPDQVLVSVYYSAMNRADLNAFKQVDGHQPILGIEFSGEILAVGDDVKNFKIGDRVMGHSPNALADLLVINADLLFALPETMTFKEAAALPVALQTMTEAICMSGSFQKGQSILFQGASSSTGIVGMQIAKLFGAKTVIGTSRSIEKGRQLKKFAADVFVNSSDGDWVDQVLAASVGGVDLVIDFLSGPTVNGNMQATKPGGTIVNVGRIAGNVGTFDFDLHNMRRIHYVGSSFRLRSEAETVAIVLQMKQKLAAALAEKKITMPIAAVYALDDAQKAVDDLKQNRNFGKVVIAVK